MSDTSETYKRDIQDYLDACGEAAKRTRNVIIVLVIATVLVFAALLNSQQANWMHRRLITMGDIHSSYVESKLGPYPQLGNFKDDAAYKDAVTAYDRRYSDLWGAVVRTYVDTSLVIRVPFFGFSFDVNDLGLLGGVGFVIILVCLRFCLTREVNNLRLSFDQARQTSGEELREFYTLLAMRQVFTVPITEHIIRSRFLVITPKLIAWSSVAVYALVTYNDATTASIGRALADSRLRFLISFEGLVLVVLILLANGVAQRLLRTDRIWDECWDEIRRKQLPSTSANVAHSTSSPPPVISS
jgi:hypothetical protein